MEHFSFARIIKQNKQKQKNPNRYELEIYATKGN